MKILPLSLLHGALIFTVANGLSPAELFVLQLLIYIPHDLSVDAVFSDQQNNISPFLMICHYSIPKLEQIGIDTTLAITDMEWIWNDIELSSVFCQKDTPLSNPDIIFSSS